MAAPVPPTTLSEALDANHERNPTPIGVDWNSWRTRQWQVLQRHCAVHEAFPDAVSDFDASTRTLIDVVAADLIRLSELFKETTKLRSLLNKLKVSLPSRILGGETPIDLSLCVASSGKEWEQEESREARKALTLLTDAVSAHPLSASDGTFGNVPPIAPPASLPTPCEQPPTASPSCDLESPPGSSAHAGSSFSSRKSDKSTRSKGSSSTSGGRSGSSYHTAREPYRIHAHHTRRPPSSSYSHGTHRASRSTGTTSSGGTTTQSVADEAEQTAADLARRRNMAKRVMREIGAVKTHIDRKHRRAIELDRKEARSSGSATSTASARSHFSASTAGSHRTRTTESSAHERRDPTDANREMDEEYRRAWAKYLSEWALLLGKHSSPSGHLLTFRTFPWPTLHAPKELKDLKKLSIATFIDRAPRSGPSNLRASATGGSALQEARLMWHPDKYVKWITKVAPAESLIVVKGADIVIRVLNDLSAENVDSGRAGGGGRV